MSGSVYLNLELIFAGISHTPNYSLLMPPPIIPLRDASRPIPDSDLTSELDRLVDAAAQVPLIDCPTGWPNEIEAAIIDSVLSVRSSYGKPSAGVRRSIGLYRGARHGQPLDDLDQLAAVGGERLARVLQDDQSKAEAIVAAAWDLTQIGVHSSAQLDSLSDHHRRTFVSIDGLDPARWEYFCLNLGKPGVTADVRTCRWVEDVVGRPAGQIETQALIMSVAKARRISPIQLERSISAYTTAREGAQRAGAVA
jgi:hypothetical protein